MRVHVATLFTHDDRGRMLRVNEPEGGPAPRFFLGRTRHGCEWRVRDDMVDHQILHELASVCVSEVVEDALASPQVPPPYEAIVSRSGPIQRIWAGPAFHFPSAILPSSRAVVVAEANAAILRPHLSSWLDAIAIYRPMLALTVGGEAVAVCASVRTTAVAHEAGVETAPDYRGRGYATAVVAAWPMPFARWGQRRCTARRGRTLRHEPWRGNWACGCSASICTSPEHRRDV
jgi:GNAT superfamily N-acetyltransferase